MTTVVLTGAFDDLRSRHVRLLHEASRLGQVHVLLWPDEAIAALEGAPPKFPAAEREYLLQSLRFVHAVTLVSGPIDRDALPLPPGLHADVWAVDPDSDDAAKRAAAADRGVRYHVIPAADLAGFPELPPEPSAPDRKKVVVTGCFDWLHSGHVRFFEEAASFGDLYVIAGHDANVRLLKGEGHPLFGQAERRYMVQAVRFVHRALISSGTGWMDAAPEIARLQPDIYVVNEDGDKPEKRAFCAEHGLEYVVLKRAPKPGLPRRQSTELRGF